MTITTDWISLAGIVAILVFLWNIHRDMRTLSDLVSRFEGRMSGDEGKIGMLANLFLQKKDPAT